MISRRGRPPKWTSEQRERVLALAAAGRNQRQIAAQVFGDARLRGRVERILNRPPARAVPELPPGEGVEAEALLASGEMAIVVELVARYERSLLEGGTVAAPAEIERLLRIKRQLAAIAMVERANALARGLERAEDEER